jgi:hypothetical protein
VGCCDSSLKKSKVNPSEGAWDYDKGSSFLESDWFFGDDEFGLDATEYKVDTIPLDQISEQPIELPNNNVVYITATQPQQHPGMVSNCPLTSVTEQLPPLPRMISPDRLICPNQYLSVPHPLPPTITVPTGNTPLTSNRNFLGQLMSKDTLSLYPGNMVIPPSVQSIKLLSTPLCSSQKQISPAVLSMNSEQLPPLVTSKMNSSYNEAPIILPLCTENEGSVIINPPSLNKNPLVSELLGQIAGVNTKVTQLTKELKEAKLPLDRTIASTFLNRISDLHQLINSQLSQTTTIEQSHVLNTISLHLLAQSRIDLRRNKTLLNLYNMEIPNLLNQTNPHPVASLFVSLSPFPTAVKQHVPVSPIHVQLLSGVHSALPLTAQDLVIAELTQSSPNFTSRKGNNNGLMRGHQTPVENGVALFDKLIFNVGTNCRPVQLKFRLSLSMGTSIFQVESLPCDPCISITNTKKWEEAQGILLKKDIFSGRAEIPVPLFCNTIQMSFMKAIRQDPMKVRRILSIEDFQFFLTSKLGKPFQMQENLTGKDFDRFWEWFGPILQKMHHHKIYVQLWMTGLLWGFISTTDAQKMLSYREPGTFLLRWVDHCDGRLAVSYKAEQEVKHFDIDTKELSGQNCIARLIRDNRVLSKFLRIQVSSDFERTTSIVDKFQGLQNITAGRFRRLYEDVCNDEKPGTIL